MMRERRKKREIKRSRRPFIAQSGSHQMTIPFSIFGFTNSATLFSPSHQINPLVPSVSLSLFLFEEEEAGQGIVEDLSHERERRKEQR
jgi:hypothetical protein